MNRPWSSRVRAISLAMFVAIATSCQPLFRVVPVPEPMGDVEVGSTLVACDQADTVVVVSVDTHLDPSCTYTAGIEVRSSGVTLDCRGAIIEDQTGTKSRGILITTPASTVLSDVTVRNCLVKGFLNSVRVTREGFKSLTAGAEYDDTTSDILIENSHLYSSRGSGVFVDGYVGGVTLRGLDIAGAGSVGIYLEAGSVDNVIEDSWIHSNGYKDRVPAGVPFTLGGTDYRYRSTGREGIAVDGSRRNIIRNNTIANNSAGGIFLYKNCGEYVTEKPAQWWERRYGADDNLIENNHIKGEYTGVWVGSRMTENQLFMDCSDPKYVDDTILAVHLDYASGNTISSNTFEQVQYGVRVEDDDTTVDGNTFDATRTGQALMVGTLRRTRQLAQPVSGTVVTNNSASYANNPTPYRWIYDHVATTFTGNTADGLPVGIEEGIQPRLDPFLFVIDYWPEP